MNFPSSEQFKDLPVVPPSSIAGGRVLLTVRDFLDLLDATLDFELSARTLKAYGSARLALAPPPVEKTSHGACYVYPDHFEWVAALLTLRRAYHLPLKTIQSLLEHFPREQFHLIIERKLSLEDLLDLAKMMPRGFEIKDVVMAKASDAMLQDLLPSSQALALAVGSGNALAEREEELLFSRLDELKAWVKSGRRRRFTTRESAEDLKNLAENRLIGKKIYRKTLARKARRSSGSQG